MSAAVSHTFAMSRIAAMRLIMASRLRASRRGLRLITDRNEKNIQVWLPFGDLGQQRFDGDVISSRAG